MDNALLKLGKKVNHQNSTVEKAADGEWKAGITFLIDDDPRIVEPKYPAKFLKGEVQLIGSTRRDFLFLWKRKDGTVGIPNGAIERWLAGDCTLRLYSTISRIVECDFGHGEEK